jgi:colicin import membrane protein
MLALALALAVGTAGPAGCSKDDKAAQEKAAAEKAAADKAAADKAAADKAAADKAAADKAAKEAEDQAVAQRTEARTKLEKNLEAAERKAIHFKEKAAKATGAMKKNAAAAAAELDKRWEAAKASLAALDLKDADWDAAAAKVEAATIQVNEAIDALEASLKKK